MNALNSHLNLSHAGLNEAASGRWCHLYRLIPGERYFLWIPETSDLLEISGNAVVSGSERIIFAADSAIDEAVSSGLSLNRDAVEKTAAEPVRISALNLILTPKCNLACVYCYAGGGDYSRIREDMDFFSVAGAVAGAAGLIDMTRGLRFEFFGGEPLLNLRAIEDALIWEREVWPRLSGNGKPVVNRISTNLTHLSNPAIEMLGTGKFIVSVSLDGTGKIQDSQRPYKTGSGSYDDIIANVTRLKSLAPELVTVARMTVHGAPDIFAEEIEAIAGIGIFDFCSIYPAAQRVGEAGFRKAMSDGFFRVGEGYSKWEMTPEGFKGCLEADRYLGHILNATAAANHCSAGIGYFSFSPDSTVHPCHRLIGDPSHRVSGGLEGVEGITVFWKTPVTRRPECEGCPYRYLCAGGCKQENLLENFNPLTPALGVCWFGGLLFGAAVRAMASMDEEKLTRTAEVGRTLEDLFVFCGQKSASPGPGAREFVRERLSHYLAEKW